MMGARRKALQDLIRFAQDKADVGDAKSLQTDAQTSHATLEQVGRSKQRNAEQGAMECLNLELQNVAAVFPQQC